MGGNGLIDLERNMVAADNQCVEDDFAVPHPVDGGRGDAHAGNVGGQELQPEKHKKVEQIVIVVVDNVIQDKGEEENQHTDKSYSQCVAQFL